MYKIWNLKINGVKIKVKYDKRIKDKNIINRRLFAVYVCQNSV